MRAKIKKSFRSIEDKKIDLIEYIITQLDGDDYDRGTLESARATADNAGRLLAKLIDTLAANGVLSNVDLSELLEEEIELILKEEPS